MAALKQTIRDDLKESLKQKDELKTMVLKMIVSSINNKEIELKKKEEGLSDEEIRKVIKSEAKKRTDAIEAYTKANRQDLSEKEEKELTIIKKYLPEELSNEEIEKIVKETIKETGAKSMQDFGKIMKEAMMKTKGQADGNRVSKIVKELLSQNT